MQRAIRIEPRVQFHAALVGLLDRERQRIVKGSGALPIVPVRYSDHGSILGGIHRVACGPDLENDGVEFEFRGAIEEGNQFRFLLAW